jgi:hypothetical protein
VKITRRMALFLDMANARRTMAAVVGASPALGCFVSSVRRRLGVLWKNRLLGSMLDAMEFWRVILEDGAFRYLVFLLIQKVSF